MVIERDQALLPAEVILPPVESETLSDEEVEMRFAEIVEQIDADTLPGEEALLDVTPTRKTNGDSEAYNMWKP